MFETAEALISTVVIVVVMVVVLLNELKVSLPDEFKSKVAQDKPELFV